MGISSKDTAERTITPVVWLVPEAAAGLHAARRWYDAHPPRLGFAFALEVEDAITRIVSNPLAFPFVRGGSRRTALRRFPHAVHFRIHHDHIVILAVIAGRTTGTPRMPSTERLSS